MAQKTRLYPPSSNRFATWRDGWVPSCCPSDTHQGPFPTRTWKVNAFPAHLKRRKQSIEISSTIDCTIELATWFEICGAFDAVEAIWFSFSALGRHGHNLQRMFMRLPNTQSTIFFSSSSSFNTDQISSKGRTGESLWRLARILQK